MGAGIALREPGGTYSTRSAFGLHLIVGTQGWLGIQTTRGQPEVADSKPWPSHHVAFDFRRGFRQLRAFRNRQRIRGAKCDTFGYGLGERGFGCEDYDGGMAE